MLGTLNFAIWYNSVCFHTEFSCNHAYSEKDHEYPVINIADWLQSVITPQDRHLLNPYISSKITHLSRTDP